MSGNAKVPATEWDAGVYHRVSSPQLNWGLRVIEHLVLAGDETVVDAGCGTGRLTERLLERLPTGRVTAIDQSANMLVLAASHLVPRFADRVSFVQLDVQEIHLTEPVDAIISTATFHWVLDHPRLFRALFSCVKPGGRFVAQCGGGPNIAELVRRAESPLASPAYQHQAAGWRNPWEFATPEMTAARLRDAGFVDVDTGLEHEPTPFPDAATFREFVTSVVLRAHLDAIDSESARSAFMDDISAMAAQDNPPFTLDYWRLNMFARRPVAP